MLHLHHKHNFKNEEFQSLSLVSLLPVSILKQLASFLFSLLFFLWSYVPPRNCCIRDVEIPVSDI